MSTLYQLSHSIRQNLKREYVYRLLAGRSLLDAVAIIPKGKFASWLDDELNLSTQTAEQLMFLAQAVDAAQNKYGLKYDALAQLPATSIQLLADADQSVVMSALVSATSSSLKPIEHIMTAISMSKKETDPISSYSEIEAAIRAVTCPEIHLHPKQLPKFKKLYEKAGKAFNQAFLYQNDFWLL